MPRFKVLLTDYAWENLDIERRTLAEIDAELVVAEQADVAALTALAKGCDAIMTNWAKTPGEVEALGVGRDTEVAVDAFALHSFPTRGNS